MITERRYDIDWLRVIAIGLLLIYHIAIVFQPWAMFIGFIRSEEPMEGLWKIMTMLNVWRIPFLFYVSGMGVYFAIRKRNWQELLLERSKRILLPFVFGIFAIAPLHMLIFQGYYNLPMSYFPHPGHLWFLGNIFAYVLILSPLFFFIKKNEGSKFLKRLSHFMRNPLAPLLVSLFFIIEVLLVRPQVFEMYAETWHGFFLGLLAFFFGFLFVSSGKAFWHTVLKWRWLYISMALALFSIRTFLFQTTSLGYLMAVESNCWILGVFGFGYKHLNQPSAVLSYLSLAAYPVYIIHMFVLYAAAMLILPLDIPLTIKLIFMITFTGMICALIYELIIRRVFFLRPLFGLKWQTKRQEKTEQIVAAAGSTH
jgi:peptidoglycan/LPS O-acetylase OafA/YrhL